MKIETYIVTRALTWNGFWETSKIAFYAWHVQEKYEVEISAKTIEEVICKMNTLGYALTATKGEYTYYFTKMTTND